MMLKSKLFWCVIIIFGIVPPIFIFLLYDYSITGSIFSLFTKGIHSSLSNKPEDWSGFGSLLSGVFTLIGSIATFTTLLFIIYQHEKMIADRKGQLILEAENESKRSLHLSQERKLMNFEMFKIHNQMFNEHLDGIENFLSNGMKFKARNVLYKMLFPNATASDFNVTHEINGLNGMEIIVRHYKSVLESLKNITDEATANDFIRSSTLLNYSLHMSTNECSLNKYDFYNGDRFIGINAFHVRRSLENYEFIVNALLDFCECQKLDDIVIDWMNNDVIINLFKCGVSIRLDEEKHEITSLKFNISKEDAEALRLLTYTFDLCFDESNGVLILPQTRKNIQELIWIHQVYNNKFNLINILRSISVSLNIDITALASKDPKHPLIYHIRKLNNSILLKIDESN